MQEPLESVSVTRLCKTADINRSTFYAHYIDIFDVMEDMEDNYAEKISVSDIAQIAGFSESHFMRYFKETMGTSFINYLKDYRLTMAARLLQSSDSSVLNIAAEVGFDNLSYFNRAFKEKFGVTPLKYRKLT